MSNTLKNKMYAYEVNPPVAVWEHIALSLNELALQKNLSKKLYNEEAIPPSTTWDKIADVLDQTFPENKFRDEVLTADVQPPEHTWSNIATQLDEGPQKNLSGKIYEYEVAPPSNTWEKIIAVLDAGHATTPVIPLRKTYNRILRMAAAAAIIGVIAWAGFSLFKKTGNSTDKEIADKDAKIAAPAAPAIKPNQDSPAEVIKETIPPTEENKLIASVNSPTKTNSKKSIKTTTKNHSELFNTLASVENHSTSNDIAIADINSLHQKNKAATTSADTASEARYLVYITDQGAMVKLSKKLADMKCIYTKEGDINQDALAKLDAAACNDRVKYWQEKVANSSLQISSNPLELIEILK